MFKIKSEFLGLSMDTDKSERQKKKRLRLVEKFENDDYSRIAGPDYSDHPFELGEIDSTKMNSSEDSYHPSGISGGPLRLDRNFRGVGPKNYRRSDERIFEEVCEILMGHPFIDASNIAVRVMDGVVYLTGGVESRETKRLAEDVVDDLAGVKDIRNELLIINRSQGTSQGPDGVTKKDLGIT